MSFRRAVRVLFRISRGGRVRGIGLAQEQALSGEHRQTQTGAPPGSELRSAPRYALLIDLASTRAAPLMKQLLLNDNAQTQVVWARWKDWCVAELV